MNERIARALAQDSKRKKTGTETIEFHDDDAVYTVTVKVERIVQKSVLEKRGGILSMSGGAPGDPCGCCGGSGRS